MKYSTNEKKQDQLFAFNRVKNLSFLPYRERAVLSFYAEQYKWNEDGSSYWSQRKICDLLGIRSEKTLRECNEALQRLKWVSFDKRFSSTSADYQSLYAQIHIGLDDPKTLEAHKVNLIKQVEKDTNTPQHQKQRDIEFIEANGRHQIELQDLVAAKENFKKHHPNIYSFDDFLNIQENISQEGS